MQAKKMTFLDNFHHKDLEPLEEAGAIQELLSDGMTQEDLAKDVGKSQSWIANRLRLLKAPDELKELLIYREISPKHIMALLPYAEYAVFKEAILPDFKRDIELGKHIAVSQMEKEIDQIIRWRSEKTALQLNDVEYKDFFDFSKCEGCTDVYTPPAVETEPDDPEDEEEKQEPERYCLNRRCWSDKLNIAKQKYEKARAEKVKTVGVDDTVDLETLKYGEYERIGAWQKWDRTECQTCKSKKTPTDPEELSSCAFVCLDPACAETKEKEQNKKEAQQTREEAEKAYEILDAYIAEKPTISDIEVRGLLKIQVRHLWGDSIKKALKPWTTKGGKWNVDEVDKIPDDDVVKALLRLVFVQDLTAHNYQGVNVKAVEKIIGVFEGRLTSQEK